MAVGASIVVAFLLWWTYFGWLKEALEHHFASAEPQRVIEAVAPPDVSTGATPLA